MNEDSIYVDRNPSHDHNSVSKEPKRKENADNKLEIHSDGMSSETKLLIVTLILVFIALNVWGYYFYRKNFFNVGADVISTPTQTPVTALEKSDSVYMVPGI
jgi:hypothetical protein